MVRLEHQRFNLWYRLNEKCGWQPAYTEGTNIADAKIALLLAVKTVYRIGSKGIEIVETFTDTPYPPPETPQTYTSGWPDNPYGDCY